MSDFRQKNIRFSESVLLFIVAWFILFQFFLFYFRIVLILDVPFSALITIKA